MIVNIDVLKKDLINMTPHDFFVRYYLDTEIWYIKCYLLSNGEDDEHITTLFKKIFADGLGVAEDSVYMSGSGKFGYSLSPPIEGMKGKLFKPFDINGTERKQSDLDIVVISSDLFDKFWKLYRTSFQYKYKVTYEHVFKEIYRGYINEKNVTSIVGCSDPWKRVMSPVKTRLQRELGFMHEMNIRVYRNIDDFEEYCTQNIKRIKRYV